MDKILCVINNNNTEKVMTTVKKALRKQSRMNVLAVIFSAVMIHEVWVMSDEIIMLKSEIRKLKQQIGD